MAEAKQQPRAAEQKPEEQKDVVKDEKAKPASPLENIVNEAEHAAKSGLYAAATGATIAGATTGAAALTGSWATGITDAAAPVLAFPLGRMLEDRLAGRAPAPMKEYFKESLIGLAYAPFLYGAVKAIEHAPELLGITGATNILGYAIPNSALAMGALTFPAIPLLNAAYYPIKYFLDNKTFKGFGKYIKEHFWTGTRRSLYLGLLEAPLIALAVSNPAVIPFLVPIFAGLEVGYRLALSTDKLKYAKLLNPSTYIPDSLNPKYLAEGIGSALGKVYKQVTSTAYQIGSLINSAYKTLVESAKPAATPAPQPA